MKSGDVKGGFLGRPESSKKTRMLWPGTKMSETEGELQLVDSLPLAHQIFSGRT